MRTRFALMIFATGMAVNSMRAQAVIEGTVTLPKPNFDHPINARAMRQRCLADRRRTRLSLDRLCTAESAIQSEPHDASDADHLLATQLTLKN